MQVQKIIKNGCNEHIKRNLLQRAVFLSINDYSTPRYFSPKPRSYNISIFLKIIQEMHYPTLFNNLFDLNTLATLPNTFLPTFTVLYPADNFSSVIDFHYKNTLAFQHNCFYLPSHSPSEAPQIPEATSTTIIINRKLKNPRNRNEKKEIESAKKNSESNLVNQLYSYFSIYEKSQKIVEKVIRSLNFQSHQLQKIKSVFYNTVRHINFKRGRKYVNKDNILAYFKPENCIANLGEIVQQLQNLRLITIEDFCYIFRVCTFHFIRDISITAVLTSKRITSVARNQHLRRRRRIFNSLGGNDSN